MTRDAGRLVIGRYRLLEVLGEGGMGAAWRAMDERIGREVVLKQVKLPSGMDDETRAAMVARMDREGRAAGMLKHPGIITVHDQFHDRDGLPWIVMELVRGPSLDRIVKDGGPLPEAEVARIGAGICEALAAAHAAGIVHRDIKPANVLLEGDRVVVTDFGVAAVTGEATLTPYGALLGTPSYMAPEQINDHQATPASDMWSLGATLYYAVEGRPAFAGHTTAALLLAVSRSAPAPTTRAQALKPVLRDLMRRDPARRPTAGAAAVALRRIAARPAEPTKVLHRPSRASRASRGTRLKILAAVVAVAALIAVPAAYLLTRPPDHPRWNRTPVAAGQFPTGDLGSVNAMAFSPDGRTLAVCGGEDKAVRLWDVARRAPAGRPLTGHTDAVFSVAFSPDGKALASGGADGTVRLWNAAQRTATGQPLATGRVRSVAFSPDGRTLATGGEDRTARLWDAASRAPIGQALAGHTGWVWSVAFSPDGETLATGGADDSARLWDVASRSMIGKPLTGHTDTVLSVAFSPDGETLATGGVDQTVRLWDVASRAPIGRPLTGHTGEVWSVAFTPDGRTLATGGEDKTVRLWDVASRTPVGQPLTGHIEPVLSVAFSPDGRILATGGGDRTVRLWRP
ncbi:WD40 repeat domain-containing serine/threonine protein kinase [Actinomadura kijaniata]|uniref:WD40 repeat domain-containing serine/threonine protein kinase n=1 Tax=Actinomadura kijaniata TaxID=46161 RepID=UPI0012F86D8E|nr:serine/threonine-protein kinase [Actinomadura kijaniata]